MLIVIIAHRRRTFVFHDVAQRIAKLLRAIENVLPLFRAKSHAIEVQDVLCRKLHRCGLSECLRNVRCCKEQEAEPNRCAHGVLHQFPQGKIGGKPVGQLRLVDDHKHGRLQCGKLEHGKPVSGLQPLACLIDPRLPVVVPLNLGCGSLEPKRKQGNVKNAERRLVL